MGNDGLLSAAERAMARDKAMAGRIRKFGYACLTAREYEAMLWEIEIIRQRAAEYREADRTVALAHMERLQTDRVALGARLFYERLESGHYEVLREVHLERLHKSIHRGIQTVIATNMGITQGRVSQLLKSASQAMEYFAAHDIRARWWPGWGDSQDTPRWVLVNVPLEDNISFLISPLIKANKSAMMKLA
jgi:imidazolonepropionase-like amidohydrolase